ncbi:hypothetical protein [Belnapia sp. F-4-1]|uniref:hypothetical protein n=1 Tax=Belnapia sp. F-4-1 TaxID=1545443 RepID=UPI0005B9F34A|nr:hypothetical protein [Belnapia sp. F-4-1]
MAEATTPAPAKPDDPRRDEATSRLATPREAGAIALALASGGSAASRLLRAMLRGDPNLAAWG